MTKPGNDSSTATHHACMAVIFDNDGVLVDSEPISLRAFRQAIQEQGMDIREEDDDRYCGLTDADIVLDMKSAYGADLDLQTFSDRKRDLYNEFASACDLPAFAGVRTLVEELRSSGIPYALASSGPKQKIAFNLQKAGLTDLFVSVTSGEDFTRGKPDPEIFLHTARTLNIEPSCCIVIEDSINGLKAARAAGMIAVGITNTFPAAKLAPFADHLIRSLEELTIPTLKSWLPA